MPAPSEIETKPKEKKNGTVRHVVKLGEGHEVYRFPNGRETRRVVQRIRESGVTDVELLQGRRMIYAVVTDQVPAGFSAEVTAVINGSGHDTRVVVVPLKLDTAFVRERLSQYVPKKLDVSVSVVDPKLIAKEPAQFIDQIIRLGSVEMPPASLPASEYQGFLAKTKS